MGSRPCWTRLARAPKQTDGAAVQHNHLYRGIENVSFRKVSAEFHARDPKWVALEVTRMRHRVSEVNHLLRSCRASNNSFWGTPDSSKTRRHASQAQVSTTSRCLQVRGSSQHRPEGAPLDPRRNK